VVTLVFLGAISLGAVVVCGVGVAISFLLHRLQWSSVETLFWNGVALAFAFVWTIHVTTELFRRDSLSLDRVMHLPLAPSRVFALNYLNGWINFPIVYFLSLSGGAVLGAAVARGPSALLAYAPLLAYVTLVTALTSQLQIQLAAWLAHPRTRTKVMMWFTIFFVIVLPAMAATIPRWLKRSDPAPPSVVQTTPSDSTSEEEESPPTGDAELEGSLAKASEAAPNRAIGRRKERWNEARWNRLASAVEGWQTLFPPLWFAAGVVGTLHGASSAWWLTTIMFAISWLSLRGNYRTTLKYYRDGFSGGAEPSSTSNYRSQNAARKARRSKELPVTPSSLHPPSAIPMEWRLPGVSDAVSAVVMQTWLSLRRAPELRLMLIAPLAQPFLGLFIARAMGSQQSDAFRSLVTYGMAGLSLYTASGILGNQFGLDRAGFRAWVLSPLARTDLLHGRNVAFGVPAWLAASVLVLTVGIWWGIPWSHVILLLMALTAFVPWYLLVLDLMAIYSPFALAPGGLEPKHFSWKHIAINLLLSTLLPALLAWCLLPLGVDGLVRLLVPSWPALPIAGVAGCLGIGLSVWAYGKLLPLLAGCLVRRELEILKTVTATVD
jgi:hypothetical protein